jgi:hypothetical protein
METETDGLLYIPNRKIEFTNERPASIRQCWYLLTDEEADIIRQDLRVFCVEIPPEDRDDIKLVRNLQQRSNFEKTTSDTGDYVNWGLLRSNYPTNVYGASATAPLNAYYDYTDVVDVVNITDWFIQNSPSDKVFDVCTGYATDLVSIARGVVDAGADGLALINTVLSMVINLDTMRPHLGGKTGGLSGPAIRPIAVRAIYQVHEALPAVPILGMGGVASGRDALELILAGAKGVSVGTASFGDPAAIITIQNELKDLLKARGFTSVAQAVGYAHRPSEDIEK